MDAFYSQTKDRVIPHMKWIADEVERLNSRKSKRGKVSFGSLHNPYLMMVYISILPTSDPAEETIDTVIMIQSKDSEYILTADICFGDGTILYEDKSLVITPGDNQEHLAQIDSYCKAVCKNLYSELKKITGLDLMDDTTGR